jgi:prophage regulatory protein
MATEQTTVILRLPEVRRRTGLGRSTIYWLMKQGDFPRAIPLAARAIGWSAAEVEAWLQSRAAERGVKD